MSRVRSRLEPCGSLDERLEVAVEGAVKVPVAGAPGHDPGVREAA